MLINLTFLRAAVLGFLLIVVQACTKETPNPTTNSNSSDNIVALARDASNRLMSQTNPNLVAIKREKAPHKSAISKPKPRKGNLNGIEAQTSLMIECYENWDIYYNKDTGEILDEVYINTVCGGGGSSGGGGTSSGGGGDAGGGGSSTGTSFPSGIYDEPVTVEQTTPTLGNYSAKLSMKPNLYQTIVVRVDLDTSKKELKKVTILLNGVTWLTQISQPEDGTLINYNAATDTYSFKANFQKELGGYWSTTRTLYGTISPSRGLGTLTIP